MADNVNIPAQGTGDTTPVIAADDVAGVKHQRVKVEFGADGVATDVSAAAPLPTVQTGALPAGTNNIGDVDVLTLPAISGTVTANIGTVGTLATESTQTAQSTLYGAVTETAPATDTASSGLNGRLQRIAQRLTSLIAQIPATLGQKTSANSLAVVVASDQSAVPVSGTVTTGLTTADLDTGGGVDTRAVVGIVKAKSGGAVNVSATDPMPAQIIDPVSGFGVNVSASGAGFVNLSHIVNSVPDVNSGNKSAGTLRVTLATDQVQLTNALKVDPSAVTSPVSAASLPLPAGAATSANQLVPVLAATATLANVAGSASSVTLQASNGARKGLVIVNDSTAILYVKFGSAASTTSFTYYLAGSVGGTPATLELPGVVYTGIVTGIWASAVGSARVTELT